MAKLASIYDDYAESPEMLNAARKFRSKFLNSKVGKRPLTGAYYWIPRPEPGGRWVMEFFSDQEYGDTSHDHIWPRFVVPAIAQMWGQDAGKLRRKIGQCYTALPRGRVSAADGGYQVIHGGNYDRRGWENKIRKSFNLGKHRNDFNTDQHMGVIESDLEKFKKALGLRDLNIAIVTQLDEIQSSDGVDEPLRSYYNTP